MKHSRIAITAGVALALAALACAVGGSQPPVPLIEPPAPGIPGPTPPPIPTRVSIPTNSMDEQPSGDLPAPANLPSGEDSASLLFGSTRDGFIGLYFLSADDRFTSGLPPTDPALRHLVWPDVSPDGTRLAVVSVQGNATMRPNGIYLIDLDGANPVQITFGEGAHPAWSPDGTLIAFTCEDGQDVCVIKADGSERVNLTADSGLMDAWPDWTADGRIVFMSSRDTGGPGFAEIYIMNADGGEITRLTNDGSAYNAHPSVWPEGGQLVYESDRDVTIGSELYIMDLNGSNQRRLTIDEVWNQAPRWSPDGSSILYGADDPEDGNIDLYLMPVSGEEPLRLTEHDSEDGGFRLGYTWLPQPLTLSSWIPETEITFSPELPRGSAPVTNAVLFATNNVNCAECQEPGIYSVNFDGANLIKTPLDGQYPAWDPDFERIAYTKSGELWIANTDGSSPIQITRSFLGLTSVHWDDRGLRLAADCVPYGQHDICLIDPDTGQIQNVTIERTFDTGIPYPNWFEDSFVLGSQLINSDGEPYDSLPAAGSVSPDGQLMATIIDGEIAVVGFDGSEPILITSDGQIKSFPQWGPESLMIIYTVIGDDGRLSLWMVRADGSGSYPLTSNPIAVGDATTYYGYSWGQ